MGSLPPRGRRSHLGSLLVADTQVGNQLHWKNPYNKQDETKLEVQHKHILHIPSLAGLCNLCYWSDYYTIPELAKQEIYTLLREHNLVATSFMHIVMNVNG